MLDVKDANGKVVRWAVETGNPNALLRAGWRKDSLKPGDEVTIEGYLAKDGTPTVNGDAGDAGGWAKRCWPPPLATNGPLSNLWGRSAT